jgi:uncharacterized protein (TIGR00369 family)
VSDGPETVAVELPADLLEQFATTTDGAEDPAVAVADLLRDRIALAESVAAYAPRDGEPSTDRLSAETVTTVRPPICQLLGADVTSVERGRAVATLAVGPRHANPMGTLHGGVLCDVGDIAMGAAFASTLEAGESFTTLELDVKFRKPVWEGEVTATAEVTDRGRRTGLVECAVTDEDDRLVAALDSVCLVLRGEAAEGR